jgi:hypothetical protein
MWGYIVRHQRAAMRRIGLIAVSLAIVGAALVVAPIASASDTRFSAAGTEDFCAPLTTCGTAATPFGNATVRTVITSFVPLPSGCFSDHHTSTLTFADESTLAIAIAGTLCPTSSFPNFTLTGNYEVVGGTDQFAGATGSGFARAFRENGPIHTLLVGTLSLA